MKISEPQKYVWELRWKYEEEPGGGLGSDPSIQGQIQKIKLQF